MKIKNPRQLKDWIKNLSKKEKINTNILLQNFMMERLLERIAISKYKDNFILKGGFLIASMIGVNIRSTMDMDTTIKGIEVTKESIEKILKEIILIKLNDNVRFEIKGIKSIHDISKYDDFRISIEANFFTIKVKMKIDITTGDKIIPKEIKYNYKLMFEERNLEIKAYNLNTILAEKIESILVRNISNTRARDFYDVYILLNLNKENINITELNKAIKEKALERKTEVYVENYKKYISDIKISKELEVIWIKYTEKYSYSKGIEFIDIINKIENIFEI